MDPTQNLKSTASQCYSGSREYQLVPPSHIWARLYSPCQLPPEFGLTLRRCLRSRRIVSLVNLVLMKVVATPVFPQRPVRPILCT